MAVTRNAIQPTLQPGSPRERPPVPTWVNLIVAFMLVQGILGALPMLLPEYRLPILDLESVLTGCMAWEDTWVWLNSAHNELRRLLPLIMLGSAVWIWRKP